MKSRASTASSKTKQRSTSTSTTNTTRRTRQYLANSLTPSTTTRPTSNASGSRAAPSELPGYPSPQKKRRRTTRGAPSDHDNEITQAGPSRPRKKRKVEVEVVKPRREPSPEADLSYEVVAQKKSGKKAVSEIRADVEQAEEEAPAPVAQSSKAAGKRKAGAEEKEKEVHVKVERGAAIDVPLSKVGPPRHLKRSRKSESNGLSSGRGSSHGERSAEPPTLSNGTTQALQKLPQASGTRPGPRSRNTTSSRRPNGLLTKAPAKSKSAGSSRPDQPEHSETDSASGEDQPASRGRNVKDVPKPTAADVSPQTRQALMQEEEENTQEAAGLYLPPEPSGRPSSPHTSSQLSQPPPVPPQPIVLRGRPSANDTFSRDGIVPETQPTNAPDTLDEPPYDPTQEDIDATQDLPSTPARPRQNSNPGNPSSVVSKMKGRTKGKDRAKEFRPISHIPPPDFTPYLVSTQFDDIEEFSSPERSARKKKPRIEPLTQDTIEDFSVDHFIDWGGGMPPEDPLPLTQEEEENAVNFSHLTPPEGQSQVASYSCRNCSC